MKRTDVREASVCMGGQLRDLSQPLRYHGQYSNEGFLGGPYYAERLEGPMKRIQSATVAIRN